IISSTSVKPRWFRIFLCQKLNMFLSSSLGWGLWTARAASLLSGFHWVHDRCQTDGDLLVASSKRERCAELRGNGLKCFRRHWGRRSRGTDGATLSDGRPSDGTRNWRGREMS